MLPRAPIAKELVLLGGGHSHLEVLRSFGMRPMPGVRLTLVTRDVHTPYSGMLPGYVSGFYSYDECHVDLSRLSTFARARLVHAEACGLDLKARRVLLRHRPPLAYDVLSVDIGISPGRSDVPGADQWTTPVKPIDGFVARLDALLERYRQAARRTQRDGVRQAPTQPGKGVRAGGGVAGPLLRCAVVGGGAGGLEVAMALCHRLEAERCRLGWGEQARAQVTLVCRGQLLPDHPPFMRKAFLPLLARQGVDLMEGDAVASVSQGVLKLASGTEVPFDECLWCTAASAAPWIRSTGLPTDASGFIAINECLQSDGGPPEVFAAGDVASCARHPRPKAGVYAVRQGAPLAANLRAALEGLPPAPFVPQSTNLALISAGDRLAVASKGSGLLWQLLWGGVAALDAASQHSVASLLWRWKDGIDRAFMAKYSTDLPNMEQMSAKGQMPTHHLPQAGTGGARAGESGTGSEAALLAQSAAMRCGGCGAKVGPDVLSRVLSRLRADHQHQHAFAENEHGPACSTADGVRNGGALGSSAGVLLGLESPDDAAVLAPPPPGHVTLQTIDYFRPVVFDPFVFGQIAANHALGDVYAMGGRPTAALALAVVPYAKPCVMEEELYQMMSGAAEVLGAAGARLVGGHSSEGQEAALGFSITGVAPEGGLMTKGGLRAGQVLVLTKALGTGAIMAAAMRGKGKGRWALAAISSMLVSNAAAARILAGAGVRGCTDVTGFGLLGHAGEMARASKVVVELDPAALPLLPGAAAVLRQGITSSLHNANAGAAANVVSSWQQTIKAYADQLREQQQQMHVERPQDTGQLHDNDPQDSGLPPWEVLTDPQTAGGLLAGVDPGAVDGCLEALREAGCVHAAVIGRVLPVEADNTPQQRTGSVVLASFHVGPAAP